MSAEQLTRREFAKLATVGIAMSGQASRAAAASPEQSTSDRRREQLDIERARRDTPGTRQVAHFNHAGASLMPRQVLDAVHDHLQLEAEIGGSEAAEAHAAQLRRTYNVVARLLGCDADEIALVENATRGWDMAFYSLRFKPGDRILTSASEYGSNYVAYLQVARRTGAVVEVLPNDEYGQVSIDGLRTELARGRVGLVGLTHIPANGGLVNPVEEVGRLTREAGVPFLLDACQAAGQWPIDVKQIGCDMLSVTGRKFLRGPRGTGFLYVRRSMIEKLEPPLLDLQAARLAERDRYEIEPTAIRFENWERSVAGVIGLGVAIEYALGWGIDGVWQRVTAIAERLRQSLAMIPGVAVRDRGRTKCGIVTFTVDGHNPLDVQKALRGRQINVSTLGRRSTPLEERDLDLVVRASVHYFNTEEELQRLVTAVQQLARRA
jgi:cysteine desulfurase / selenocysteine lyase